MEHDFCKSCGQRGKCFHACPELSRHLGELEVGQKEFTVAEIKYGVPWPQILREMPRYSNRETEIVRLIMRGKKRQEICKLLNISSENYYMILCRIRKKAKKLLS